LALLHIGSRGLDLAAAGYIFRAFGRPDMRWIEGEIRSADAELSSVGIDPFPERFGRIPSQVTIGAVDADDVGGESVAIAAAETAAVI